MAGHVLEKYYNSFGGVDTRSNKLLMNPKTFRSGSKNFRYNFQDEMQNANGFQRKALVSGFTSVGDFEYKFNDLITGQEKIEYLCVGSDGNLYKRLSHSLKFTSLGTATSYSFYYDEVADSFKFKLNSYAEITVSDTMTMDQLRIAINALGPVCVVVDDSGLTVTSTKIAHYQDVIIDKVLSVGIISEASSWFFEAVEYPSKGNTDDQVPFITTKNYLNDVDYEGISSININNSCYIADGGFVMKYDGKCVYRAGMPKILRPNANGTQNVNGFIINQNNSPSGALTLNGKYKYVYQLGFVDYNGVETLGTFDLGGSEFPYLTKDVGSLNSIVHNFTNIYGALDFPIFSCLVSADQNIPDAGGVINVLAGHNIKVGMLLRIPVSNAVIAFSGHSYLMTRVSAVTATTITVEFGISAPAYHPFQPYQQLLLTGTLTTGSPVVTTISSTSRLRVGYKVSGIGISAGTTILSINSATQITLSANATASGSQTLAFQQYNTLLISQQVLNGGFAADEFKNTITNPNPTNYNLPEIKFGAFLRIYRTTANADIFYREIDFSISHKYLQQYVDILADVDVGTGLSAIELSRVGLLDSNQGNYLPRVCKYLTVWQDQIVQSGRPVDISMLDQRYPGAPAATFVNSWGLKDTSYLGYNYTESDLCDYQSIYWNDSSTPEGFPQDGLHEFLIETKFNDRVKGTAPNKDALFAFKERSTGILVGSLSAGDLNLEILEDDIGLANHRTIQEVRGSLVWLDPVNGFYSCVAGRLPENIGFPISDSQKINSEKLDYNKAVAANFRKESLYICSLGAKKFVFDYASDGSLQRNCWYIWDRLDAKSILATSDDQLLISDGAYTWKMKVTNTKYDFTDHKSAIDFMPITAWLTSGAPTVDKHHINLWLSSIQGGFTLDVIQYGNYLDTPISTLTNLNFPAETVSKKNVKNNFKCAQPKLSSVSFGFKNSQKNQFVRIQGYELELSADFDSGEPKL